MYKVEAKKAVQQDTPKYQNRCEPTQNEIVRKSYSDKLVAKIKEIKPTHNLDENASKLEKTIKEVVEESIPAKKTAKKPWVSEVTLKLADEKRQLKMTKKNASTQKEQQYKDLCKKVKKATRQDKEHWIQQQCEEIEKGLTIGNTRQVYSLIKNATKKFHLSNQSNKRRRRKSTTTARRNHEKMDSVLRQLVQRSRRW